MPKKGKMVIGWKGEMVIGFFVGATGGCPAGRSKK